MSGCPRSLAFGDLGSHDSTSFRVLVFVVTGVPNERFLLAGVGSRRTCCFSCFVSGHGFIASGKMQTEQHEVSGHDFSRAATASTRF
jgi:hypothetical protein